MAKLCFWTSPQSSYVAESSAASELMHEEADGFWGSRHEGTTHGVAKKMFRSQLKRFTAAAFVSRDKRIGQFFPIRKLFWMFTGYIALCAL
mmetsp:Transcript_5645/g.23933  ORF Transcript_5645/g.23933 Transcript_5645/m.23933 type:complete len:91 (-) Transcript_5645:1803-2075(-)